VNAMPFVKKFSCPKCGSDKLSFHGYTKHKEVSHIHAKFHGKPYFKCRKCQTFVMNLEDEGIFIWGNTSTTWELAVGKFVFR